MKDIIKRRIAGPQDIGICNVDSYYQFTLGTGIGIGIGGYANCIHTSNFENACSPHSGHLSILFICSIIFEHLCCAKVSSICSGLSSDHNKPKALCS
jgi:hypothetical protein